MRAWRPVAWWIAAVFASGVALVIVDPHPASKTSAVGPAVTRATTGAPPSTAPADLASLLIDLSPDGYALAPDFPMDLDLEAVAAGRTTEGTDARRTELTDDGFGRGVTAVWSSGDQMSTAAIRVYEFGSDAGADRFFRFDKRNAASAVGSRPFAVTTVPSAYGYGYDEDRGTSGTYPVQQVIFAKGPTVFIVRVNGVHRPVDPAEAISLAERQFAAG